MRRSLPSLAVAALLTALLGSTAPADAQAHKSGTSGQTHQTTIKSGKPKAAAQTSTTHPASKSTSAKSSASHSATKAVTTPRVRSEAAKHDFWKQSGYPKGRPGYVVDHIVPLACGGADAPSNMQWQTVEAGKAKDKVERVGCRK